MMKPGFSTRRAPLRMIKYTKEKDLLTMREYEKLPFTSLLEELRKRLITAFIAVGVGFVVSFGF